MKDLAVTVAALLIVCATTSVRGNDLPVGNDVEVVVVTAYAPGSAHERMKSVYRNNYRGASRFLAGDYDMAYEPLLMAARSGMKNAQERLSLLYRHGWGVEHDDLEAAAWLAVAASGKSHPNIEQAWSNLRAELQEQRRGRGRLSRKIAAYHEAHSSETNGVVCKVIGDSPEEGASNPNVERMDCYFREDSDQQALRESMLELREELEVAESIGDLAR